MAPAAAANVGLVLLVLVWVGCVVRTVICWTRFSSRYARLRKTGPVTVTLDGERTDLDHFLIQGTSQHFRQPSLLVPYEFEDADLARAWSAYRRSFVQALLALAAIFVVFPFLHAVRLP